MLRGCHPPLVRWWRLALVVVPLLCPQWRSSVGIHAVRLQSVRDEQQQEQYENVQRLLNDLIYAQLPTSGVLNSTSPSSIGQVEHILSQSPRLCLGHRDVEPSLGTDTEVQSSETESLEQDNSNNRQLHLVVLPTSYMCEVNHVTGKPAKQLHGKSAIKSQLE